MKCYCLFYNILIIIVIRLKLITTSDVRSQYLIDLAELLNDKTRYDKNLFPLPLSVNRSIKQKIEFSPIQINVSIIVTELGEISEVTMSFRAEIYLTQIWNDPRLIFTNENYQSLGITAMSPEILEKIWRPDTFFSNVLRSTSPPKDDDSFTHKNYVGINVRGNIIFSQRLSLTAACYMNLKRYPFDHQLCKLSLESYSTTNKSLIYKWSEENSVIFEFSEENLLDFVLVNVSTREKLRSYPYYARSTLNFCFIVKRKTLFYIMAFYLPGFLIVAVTWLASMQQESSFSDLLEVLLAHLFLYFSCMTVTPKVSEIKSIEIFLVGCFLFIFAALVETFLINNVHFKSNLVKPINLNGSRIIEKLSCVKKMTRQKEENENTMEPPNQVITQSRRATRNIIFPVAFVIFCFFYFMTYIYVLHDYNLLDKCN